ncbi:hypothetical protein MOQ72_42895 [Saccharopolyspora sp. K220]|uniref:hypothetical protein n=1 Tax=Saccharopolyspora soli TaxID=2926618 RepID=UPI001F56EC75|nr:hypothetical protein [Saccharopolyspora soli]MCI2424163.1 hypothetical protein [Saccharopolyspora soli]
MLSLFRIAGEHLLHVGRCRFRLRGHRVDLPGDLGDPVLGCGTSLALPFLLGERLAYLLVELALGVVELVADLVPLVRERSESISPQIAHLSETDHLRTSGSK